MPTMNENPKPASRDTRDGREIVILASASAARAALLEGAGVAFEAVPAHIDEDEVKAALKAEGAGAADIAVALATLKAQNVSRRWPGRLVIGADQVLEFDGRILDKPPDRAAARAQLTALRGHAHDQVCCVCVVRDGQRLWHEVARARLFVRAFTDEFLDSYLDAIGDEALTGPGAYQLEGRGAQLFERIEGDYFTILGLPLIPLLDYLRLQKVLPI